jgi:hypothetical protein
MMLRSFIIIKEHANVLIAAPQEGGEQIFLQNWICPCKTYRGARPFYEIDKNLQVHWTFAW